MSFITTAGGLNTLGSVGGVISGVGGLMTAHSQIEAGNENANIAMQEAESTRNSFQLYSEQFKKNTDAAIGHQAAVYAKSGVKMAGSPIDVMVDSLTNANLDLAIKKYNSDVVSVGLENKAAMIKYQARQAAAATYAKSAKSFLEAGLNLGTNINRVPQMKTLNGEGVMG